MEHAKGAEVEVGASDDVRGGIASDAEARMQRRLHCVQLVNTGHPVAEVARRFGFHRRTLERWLAHYRRAGEAGLQDEGRCGRPPRLNAEQCDALRRELAGSPRALGYSSTEWSGRLLRSHLAGRLGVRFSLRQCQRLLRSLRPAPPPIARPVPGRASTLHRHEATAHAAP